MPDTADDLLQALTRRMPVAFGTADPATRRTGLVIVDEVNGFATVGAGNLAPPVENPQVTRMVAETDRLARVFQDAGWPILAFLDTHEPGKPEPPYPPHCERGTGEEELVPALKWLESAGQATLIRKDCINGYIGSIEHQGDNRGGGRNRFADWVLQEKLEALLVVGICTDICVMDFVLTALSARNHGLLGDLTDIFVYADGCSTYHLPGETAAALGLPATAAHDQEIAHHMGLYFMASRGAVLVDQVALRGR